MVYCTKCGTLNADDPTVCDRHMRYEGEYYGYYRRRGALATLILGLIIIFSGFLYLWSVLSGTSIPWWPTILILLGVYILARGIMRSRRYRQ